MRKRDIVDTGNTVCKEHNGIMWNGISRELVQSNFVKKVHAPGIKAKYSLDVFLESEIGWTRNQKLAGDSFCSCLFCCPRQICWTLHITESWAFPTTQEVEQDKLQAEAWSGSSSEIN